MKFLSHIDYHDIIQCFIQAPPGIHHLLIQTFQILPFDEQPDEDFDAMHQLCESFITKVFPEVNESGLLNFYETIGFGFDSVFSLYYRMCTSPERTYVIYKSYCFLDLIHLSLKESDVNTTIASLRLISHMISILGDRFSVIDIDSVIKLCEHPNDTIKYESYHFLHTSLIHSQDYYDFFRGYDIMKFMLGNFWDSDFKQTKTV